MYTKRDTGGAGNTVVFVVAMKFGENIRALPKEKKAEFSRYMLARILQRNAKRRQEFKPGPLSKVLIDGAQAYKATFTDVGLGVAGRGCVYILISGPYLVNMSIRQRIEARPEDLAAAAASLESLKLKR